MAIQQEYRGNPSLKQYQLSQNFVGGLNTKEADDVVTDIEFRELLNADLGNQGIITNRKGFKDLIIFNAMMENAVTEQGDPASFPTGIFRLAKVAKDTSNIVGKLVEFDNLTDFRNSLVTITYEFIILFLIDSDFYRLKVSKKAGVLVETVEFQLQLKISTGQETQTIFGEIEPSEDSDVYFQNGVSQLKLSLPYTNLIPIPAGYSLTSVTLKTIEYQVFADNPLVGELKIQFPVQTNEDNPDNALIYTDVELPNTNYLFSPVPGFENFNLDITADFFGLANPEQYFGVVVTPSRDVDYKNPVGNTNNATLVFRFVIEYLFTGPLSTLSEVNLGSTKSKISVNNIEFLDSVYVLPGDGAVYEYEILNDRFYKMGAFQPSPFDVKFIGFNVLADNPLTYIADQGVTNKNIEGVFLTVDGNKPIQAIPGGVFQINVIHTGINFTTDEVGMKFFMDFGTPEEEEIIPRLLSAQDLGGLFVFTFNAVGLSKFVGKQLSITIFELDKTTGSDITEDVGPNSVVSGDTIIKVADSSSFILEKDFVLSQTSLYETVRVKEIIDATNIKVYGRLLNLYELDQGARVFLPEEKTTVLSFDRFFDSYPITSGFTTIPQPVVRVDLKGFRMVEIDFRMVYYGEKVIWFSDLYQFDYIPNYNFVSLPLGTTDEIQRIVFFRGNYIVFTKDEIYKLSGTFGAPDFRVESVNKFVGCIAPNSVRNVGNELLFLSRDGLYKLKSSVFQDNLENVEKIDKVIVDDVQISEFVDSLLYDEQYILYYNEGEQYDTLRMYYDIDLGRSRSPFVRDIFTIKPELLVREEGQIFALSNGRWYIYGEGFTDFMPDGEEDASTYTYTCRIETPSLSLRFPTHEKKFKNLFIKALHGTKIIPLFVTVKVDNYEVLVPSESFAFVNQFGEVEYSVSADPNITLQSSAFLGEMELANTPLGEITQQVHKLSFSGKGKNIKVIIEQKLDASFGIISMGYLFKLGKVKE